jgi:hypothetical protein
LPDDVVAGDRQRPVFVAVPLPVDTIYGVHS